MIDYIYAISNDEGYRSYSNFHISEGLKDILFDDYYLYNSKEFKREDLVERLYKENFINKYDRETQKEIFDLYIDNEKFKKKAQFIYSLIDYEKYKLFVEKNPDIENPNHLRIIYNVVDSEGVKVTLYDISIIDISFVF